MHQLIFFHPVVAYTDASGKRVMSLIMKHRPTRDEINDLLRPVDEVKEHIKKKKKPQIPTPQKRG